jgi:ATP-dependent RNA helicase DDX41
MQVVKYVREEDKMGALLQALTETRPPVLIFSENKMEVDSIQEYLLKQGVEVVAIHGSKDQEERIWAMDMFKEGKKDVLIATDVASKGLDFPKIEHVINFDMPREIENYVHRIGRTGRAGQKGVATTFINSTCEGSILLDLKHVLKEAKQNVPTYLLELEDPNEQADELAALATGTRGCAYCGGLGHRITDCPKLRTDTRLKSGGHGGGVD